MRKLSPFCSQSKDNYDLE